MLQGWRTQTIPAGLYFHGGVYFTVGLENLYMLLTEVKGNAWMVKLDR